MQPLKVFIPISVNNSLPVKNGYYEVTCLDKGEEHKRIAFFHEKSFYWGETLELIFTNVTHWLSEQEGYFFTAEELKEVYSKDEVKNMIQNIYSEFAETQFQKNHVTLRHIIEIEIEGHPNKPIKIFTDK